MPTPTYNRADLIAYMARTIEVLSYMAWCDAWDEATGTDQPRPEDCVSAGPGEDWFDVAPELDLGDQEDAGISWREEAAILYGRVWQAWGGDPWAVLRDNGIDRDAALDWAHCAVMSAVGHGVSWEDDHEPLLFAGAGVFVSGPPSRICLDVAPAWPDRWPAEEE